MNDLPDNKENIIAVHEAATDTIKNTFEEAIGRIAAEQVRLALESQSEGIRLKAGQKIIDHVIGQPLQRVEQRGHSIQIISHLGVPGFEEKPVKLELEKPVERLPEPPSGPPKELRAAVSPSTKSRYGARISTDPKKGKGVPLPAIGESPAPSEDPTPRSKL